MTTNTQHRLVSGGIHARSENGLLKSYKVGDVVEGLSESEIAALGGRVELVAESAALPPLPSPTVSILPAPASIPVPEMVEAAGSTPEESNGVQEAASEASEVPETTTTSEAQDVKGNPWSDYLSASTVPEVLKAIAALETVDDLRLVQQAERDGKQRSTVLNTLETRLASMVTESENV
jgi:hypothetical protein